MNPRLIVSAALGVGAGLLVSSVAMADDLWVETMWNQEPSTVPSGFSPDDWTVTTIWGPGMPGSTQWPEPARVSFTALSDGYWVMGLFMPNWVDRMPWKTIDGVINTSSSVDLTIWGIHGENNGRVVTGSGMLERDPSDPDGLTWNFSAFMHPNPDFEWIEFRVPVHPSVGNPIESISMFTLSYPSPGTIGVLAVAGVIASGRRRAR